jgi:hypothetical protein
MSKSKSHSSLQNLSVNSSNQSTSQHPTLSSPSSISQSTKKIWEKSLRECISQDKEKCGFISVSLFHSILNKTLLSASPPLLTVGELSTLISTYRTGNDVDYRTCFRHQLTRLFNESGPLSTEHSVFQMAPLTKSRSLGPSHPWDFNYQLSGGTAPLPSNSSCALPSALPSASSLSSTLPLSSSDPYWKRACQDPKPVLPPPSARPMTSVSISPFSSSLVSPLTSSNLSDERLITILKGFLHHPNSKALFDSYRRNQLVSHPGNISNRYFFSSLTEFDIAPTIKKKDVNYLLKIYRAIGLPDTFNFQEMLSNCQQIKERKI